MLACSWNSANTGGNILAYLADALINSGNWDRVILVPTGITSTSIAEWDVTYTLTTKVSCAMARLAARGITPSTTGVTVCWEWGQGESDTSAGTTQVAYATSLNSIITKVKSYGMSGRIFIGLETYELGITSTPIRAAQASVVDSVTVFQSGDTDTLGSGSRSDNIHFTAAGASAAATLIYNAMLILRRPILIASSNVRISLIKRG